MRAKTKNREMYRIFNLLFLNVVLEILFFGLELGDDGAEKSSKTLLFYIDLKYVGVQKTIELSLLLKAFSHKI